MLRFWQSLVINGTFTDVLHHFPERGHSYLPCDRHFGMIERKQSKIKRAETFEEWNRLIEESYAVVRVDREMIKNF